MPTNVLLPAVTESQLENVTLTIARTAKVAIDALIPERRMIATSTTAANSDATTPDKIVASDGGTVVSSKNFGRAGKKSALGARQQSCHAVAYAPTAMNAVWPNEITPELPTKMYSPTT